VRISPKSVLLASAFCLSLTSHALAEGPRKPTGYQVPKDSLGRPDLNGSWDAATMTPMQRMPGYGTRIVMTKDEVDKAEGIVAARVKLADAKTPLNATLKDLPEDGSVNENAQFLDPGTTIMRVHGEPRSSLLTTPDGYVPPDLNGKILVNRPERPPTELNRNRSNGLAGGDRPDPPGRNDNPEGRSLGERCLLSFTASVVIQPGLYNSNYQIQQSRNVVAIESEMIHHVRAVRLNSKHRTDGVRNWYGDSIGWYEGNTLVVETIGFEPRTPMFGGKAEQLKVTERFTRVAKDRLLYQFTIEDPKTWAKPWGGEYELKASNGLYEYACAEGNYGLENILAGARAEEAQAKTTASK
jgi:hypothetical protein